MVFLITNPHNYSLYNQFLSEITYEQKSNPILFRLHSKWLLGHLVPMRSRTSFLEYKCPGYEFSLVQVSLGYEFSLVQVSWVQVLLSTSVLGTSSPEYKCPEYEFSLVQVSWVRVLLSTRVLGTSSVGYEYSWVRVLLGTSAPG